MEKAKPFAWNTEKEVMMWCVHTYSLDRLSLLPCSCMCLCLNRKFSLATKAITIQTKLYALQPAVKYTRNSPSKRNNDKHGLLAEKLGKHWKSHIYCMYKFACVLQFILTILKTNKRKLDRWLIANRKKWATSHINM